MFIEFKPCIANAKRTSLAIARRTTALSTCADLQVWLLLVQQHRLMPGGRHPMKPRKRGLAGFPTLSQALHMWARSSCGGVCTACMQCLSTSMRMRYPGGGQAC